VCQGGGGLYPADCPRFGQPGNFLANNKTHRVDFNNTLTSTGEAAQWVLNNKFPALDFTWVWVDGDDYDVRIIDASYPNATWYGSTPCPDGATTGGTIPRRWCYGRVMRLNTYLAAAWNTTFGQRVLLCHELGHSIGINHPDGGTVNTTCMENEEPPDAAGSNNYDSADINNVLGGY
jgi:hypothetical protein